MPQAVRTEVLWEATRHRTGPPGNNSPPRDQNDAYGAMRVQTACGEEKVA